MAFACCIDDVTIWRDRRAQCDTLFFVFPFDLSAWGDRVHVLIGGAYVNIPLLIDGGRRLDAFVEGESPFFDGADFSGTFIWEFASSEAKQRTLTQDEEWQEITKGKTWSGRLMCHGYRYLAKKIRRTTRSYSQK